jgi:hypothetical protein
VKTGALFEPASRPAPGIIDIGDRKQHFLDDLLVDEASRISRYMSRPDKYADNPIMAADRPWEQGKHRGKSRPTGRAMGVEGVEIVGQTVLYDEEDKIFKMWYVAWALDTGRRPWCYATSEDGYHWDKPDLGLIEFEGSTQNNLLGIHGEPSYYNTFKDPRDPDPQRRYKAQGEMHGPGGHGPPGGMVNAYSPDGIHWTYDNKAVVVYGPDVADASSVLGWDPKRQKYVGYFRPGHPLSHEIDGIGRHRHIRTVGYAESDDFVHWTPTRIMLAPDDKDRVDTQYQYFTAGLCGEFYVAFLMVHKTHEQIWDTYLMSSRDGFHWTWVDRHEPFLGRGEIGSLDAGYMMPSGPIVHDGRIWIYYTGFSGAHSANPTKLGDLDTMTINLATLPQDRWAGLLAGPNQGRITTRPFTFKGSRLLIDVDASTPQSIPTEVINFDECEVRAALVDQSGGPLEGFTFERSSRILQSGVHEMSWEGADLSRLQGEPVRLRLEMRSACLFSIQFS